MSKYAKVVVKIPDLKKPYDDYSKPSVKKANMDMCKRIANTFGRQISKWGEAYEIPSGILVGFIATESGGRNLEPNPFKATGLMQVTPGAVYESFRKYKKVTKNNLPDITVSYCNSKIPEILGSNTISTAITNKILNLLEKDPEFNIMCGTTYMRFTLEMYSYTTILLEKKAPLNKSLIAYNAGAYHSTLKEQPNQSSDTTYLANNRRVPSQSRDYLFKMLGIDGYLQLIYFDLPGQGFRI